MVGTASLAPRVYPAAGAAVNRQISIQIHSDGCQGPTEFLTEALSPSE